jgi:hypothetical protein
MQRVLLYLTLLLVPLALIMAFRYQTDRMVAVYGAREAATAKWEHVRFEKADDLSSRSILIVPIEKFSLKSLNWSSPEPTPHEWCSDPAHAQEFWWWPEAKQAERCDAMLRRIARRSVKPDKGGAWQNTN